MSPRNSRTAKIHPKPHHKKTDITETDIHWKIQGKMKEVEKNTSTMELN